MTETEREAEHIIRKFDAWIRSYADKVFTKILRKVKDKDNGQD